MKIVSASVKVIDDKNHVSILSLEDVDITIKGPQSKPIEQIPVIEEPPVPKKKTTKKKNRKE